MSYPERESRPAGNQAASSKSTAAAANTTHSSGLASPFAIHCEYCRAVPKQQCTNRITGRPLRKALAHPVRIHQAEILAQAVRDA